jgi:hypothetical protein
MLKVTMGQRAAQVTLESQCYLTRVFADFGLPVEVRRGQDADLVAELEEMRDPRIEVGEARTVECIKGT